MTTNREEIRTLVVLFCTSALDQQGFKLSFITEFLLLFRVGRSKVGIARIT